MVFLDAGIPVDNRSRIDFLPPEAISHFNAARRDGWLAPLWSDDDLVDEIPDTARRRKIVDQLVSIPTRVYEEPIPVPEGSLDGRHLFILFTEGYRESLKRARAMGWATVEMPGRHFHAVNAPEEVAGVIAGFLRRRGGTQAAIS